jgi:hypothetical protein
VYVDAGWAPIGNDPRPQCDQILVPLAPFTIMIHQWLLSFETGSSEIADVRLQPHTACHSGWLLLVLQRRSVTVLKSDTVALMLHLALQKGS